MKCSRPGEEWTPLTSAISCLLSTTSSGTLSKMERNLSTASSNLPTVVSW